MKTPPRPYGLFLLLYPAAHRREYGDGMREVLSYRYEQGRRERRSRVALHAELAWDLLWNAGRVWTERIGRSVMGVWKGVGLDGAFVLRSLRRSPGYTLTAIVVLAGAVAVNASVFSFVRGTLLRAPPYPEPDDVVVVWGSNAANGQLRDVVSGPNFIDLAREAATMESMAAFHPGNVVLVEDGRPSVLDALDVSVDFLRVLRVEPELGRDFDDADRTSSAPATVILSHAFWRDRLGSDPSAVGRSLPLNGEPYTILGVLPEDFEFILPAPMLVPLRDDELAADNRYRIHYWILGRLRGGATPAEAGRELNHILGRIAGEYPGYTGWSFLVEPLHRVSVEAVRPVLWTLTAAVGLVLLLALVNLATLFRIRTAERARELSIRLALGAGWGRIARILLLESGVLATVAAVLGLVLASAALGRITGLVPTWVPIPESAASVPVLRATLDPFVAAVALSVALLGGLLLTLPGFLSVVRRARSPRPVRGDAGLRSHRGLVALELALATVLCLGAGLTTRSVSNLLATDVGLDDEGLLTLWTGDVWDRTAEERTQLYREMVDQIRTIPGVMDAAVIGYVPFLGEDDFARIRFPDRPPPPPGQRIREEWRRVSEGLFETAGMRILRGRSLTSQDFQGAPQVAVVNESFAAKYFPGGAAVGRRVGTHDDAYQDLEIVGVVADVHAKGPANPAPPMLYVPLQGNPRGTTGMYVRVAGDPMSFAGRVQDAIWRVDSTQPVARVFPMSELVANWVAIPRAARDLVSGLATLSLLLAAVGVFGVVAFVVRTRSRELGVRLALGASPGRLKRDMMRKATPIVFLGVATGLALGVLAAGAATAILFGVAPLDPASVGLALGAMVGTALLATYLPTRRLARIDPTEAIRAE